MSKVKKEEHPSVKQAREYYEFCLANRGETAFKTRDAKEYLKQIKEIYKD